MREREKEASCNVFSTNQKIANRKFIHLFRYNNIICVSVTLFCIFGIAVEYFTHIEQKCLRNDSSWVFYRQFLILPILLLLSLVGWSLTKFSTRIFFQQSPFGVLLCLLVSFFDKFT